MAPSNALTTVACRTWFLSPSNRKVFLIPESLFNFQAIQTVPTGLSIDPPPGPAIPLIETPRLALLSFKAPVTISQTTASLTAPYEFKVSLETPRTACFEMLEYVIKLQPNHAELPGTDTIDWDSNPPVQDSAAVKYISFFCSNAPKSALRVSNFFNSNLQNINNKY